MITALNLLLPRLVLVALAGSAGAVSAAGQDSTKSPEMFEREVAAHYHNAQAHCKLGLEYLRIAKANRLRIKKGDRVIREFEKAIKLRPDYYPAYTGLGYSYQWMGEHVEEAISAFTRAVELSGGQDAEALLGLGQSYYEECDYPKAEESLKRYVALQPSDRSAKILLIRTLCLLHRDQDALNIYRDLALEDPDISNLRLPFYQAYGEQLISLWKEVIQKHPGNALAFSQLGELYSDLVRPNDAIAPLKEAMRMKPDDARLHYQLGLCYVRIGDRDAAKRELAELRAIEERLQLASFFSHNLGVEIAR